MVRIVTWFGSRNACKKTGSENKDIGGKPRRVTKCCVWPPAQDWNMQKLIAGKRKFTQSQEKAGDFGTKTAVGHTDFGFRFRNFAFPKKELDWMSWVFSSYTGGPPVHWKEPGTRETDVECAPCQPGTFSDHESHQNVCTPHRTCQSVLVPGNSTHNTVCGNPGRQVDPETTTTPQLTTTTKRLLWRLGTERPTFNQQHPLAQTGQIVGMTAIPVVLVALICFIVFRKSAVLACRKVPGAVVSGAHICGAGEGQPFANVPFRFLGQSSRG
ncbi:hypothetical protein E2320_006130 [Naja naja]|nr:hypothetical protein E2320_006130 [Naja naja]